MSSVVLPNPSFAQSWRKPISICCAVIWLFAAVFTVPRGFASGWHEAVEFVGFLLLIIAAQGRIWSMVYIVGRKNRELCQSGPYSLMRNPLYFFSFIGVVGLALALQHVLLGLIAGAGFLIYYAAVIRGEERMLTAIHGDCFTDYQKRVPRFWPRWAMPDGGGDSLLLHVGPFMRGLREVFWFLAVIILAEILEWAHLEHVWYSWPLPF
jgi:protein-S-isoprenylcysteine O-methyltransferase Ste14